MNNKNKAVLGIYKTRTEIEKAIDSLKNEGFFHSDISVLMPELSGSQDFSHVKGSKAPEGAVAGAGTGAVVGGTLGLLVGLGAIAIPGAGPFIAAGPIMAVMAGIGAGGALGGIGGALVGMGIPEYEAKRYEGFIKDGGILLSVHTDTPEQLNKAKKCLELTGATAISSTSEAKEDWPESTFYPTKDSTTSPRSMNP